MSASSETTRYCGSCGAARESGAVRFCRSCGKPFDAAGAIARAPKSEAKTAPVPAAATSVLAAPRQRAPAMVAALAFLSGGTYTWFWLWRSWLEMKHILQERSMRPFWHAVATVVPLYGLFRVHEHFRVLDELLKRAGIPVRAGAALLTLIYVFLVLVTYWGIAYGLSLRSLEALTAQAGSVPASRQALAPLSLVVVAMAQAYVVASGQFALNAYYRSRTDLEVPLRTHGLEWIFLALFAVQFALTFAL